MVMQTCKESQADMMAGRADDTIISLSSVMGNQNQPNCPDWSTTLNGTVQVGGPGLAVIDDGEKGPMFGAEGLSIPLQASDTPRIVHSRLGTFYQNMPDGSRSLFPEGKTTELADLKVYPVASCCISTLELHVLDDCMDCLPACFK